MKATIKRGSPGEWYVYVGKVLVNTVSTKKKAREIKKTLALPYMYLDNTSDDIDLSGPDGSSAKPYPAEKLPDTPHE
jgi:hypothetical protein